MPPARSPRRSVSRRATMATLLVLLIGVWLGGHPGWIPSGVRGAFVADTNGRFVDGVIGAIERDYYRKVSPTDLVNKGLAGAVASLGDPYSHYFDPKSYQAFQQQGNPHVTGIGIDILRYPDAPLLFRGLLVVDAFPSSPAATVGLGHGDVITAVNGRSLAGRDESYATTLIKGTPGTRVRITYAPRANFSAERTVTLTRAAVVVPVAGERDTVYKGEKVGVIQLTTFEPQGTAGELRQQVRTALAHHAQALVLDLRQNGGGLLNEAVGVASAFLSDGTIVSTAGRNQRREVYTAKGDAIAPNIPMVVLVDRGTASAAEIVAGALKDRGRAKVIGEHTYGKGVFQEILDLSNGGALDITVGEYFTPSGRNLGGGGVRQGAGIQPDVMAVDDPRTPRDEALDAALRTVTGK